MTSPRVLLYSLANALLPASLAFLSASVAGALLVALLGYSPALVFQNLLYGAVGDLYSFSESLLKATPLLFTGLAVALAFQAGVWNIGSEGQFLMGALIGGAVALNWLSGFGVMTILASIAGAALAGALWGLIAGWLRERRGVSEVISTIMLNLIALQLLSYAVHGPLQEIAGHYPQSDRLPAALQLGRLLSGTRLHVGLLLAILLAIAGWLMIYRSAYGFRLRAIGANATAARFAGINLSRHLIWAMVLSGAVAGLGGAIELLGVTFRLYENFSPGYGFTAIAVALLARLNPLGIMPAAFLFGALATGTKHLQRSMGVSPVLAEVIQALVILFVALYETQFVRDKLEQVWQRRVRKRSKTEVATDD